jgi:S-DNA-T family DNA segregation ATPase FtsK/SpoIIIE
MARASFEWFRLRIEDREDRRQGEVAASKRDEVVVTERAKYVEKHAAPPIRAEPAVADEDEFAAAPAPGFLAKAMSKVGKARPNRRRRPVRAEPRAEPQGDDDAFRGCRGSMRRSHGAPRLRGQGRARRLPLPSAAPGGAIKIEPQMVSVPRSERAEKERRRTLFERPAGRLAAAAAGLLDEAPPVQETVSIETLEFTSRLIEKKLSDFGVEAKVVAAYPGPVVTRYEIEPATGVKGSQIVNLARDLARSLSLTSIRVVETIPGKNYMALELPNPKRQIVRLTEIVGSKVYNDSPRA